MSIYRLTLAWISSENSTTHDEYWLILTQLPSLLWTSSHPTGLSAVRCRLATRVTLRQLPSSSSFVQLPSRVPLPTSGHAEILSPKPFVWFRTKTDKGIVCLADLLHSVTQLMIYHHLSLGKMYVYRITKLGNGNQQQSLVNVRNPDHTSFNSQIIKKTKLCQNKSSRNIQP